MVEIWFNTINLIQFKVSLIQRLTQVSTINQNLRVYLILIPNQTYLNLNDKGQECNFICV